MKYREGGIGRVFVVKIEHGDDFLECIKQVATKEMIENACFQMIGATQESDSVVGPIGTKIPTESIWKYQRNQGLELVGLGTIFKKDNIPSIHLHAAIGNAGDVNVGCIRANTKTFIVLEVIIMEITGVDAIRVYDENMGLYLLDFVK
jgi:predicted DNA-binding protein with PD1-like motif